jgi:Tfp pilus assembly protein PilN
MQQQINLLSAIPRAAKLLLPGKMIFWSWAGFLVLLFMLTGMGYMQIAKLRGQVLSLQNDSQQAMMQTNNLLTQKAQMKNQQEIANDMVALQQLLRKKQNILATLQGIHNDQTQENFSKILKALASIQTPNVWLNDFTLMQGGTELELHGMAMNIDSVTAYLEQINKMRLLSDKEFTVLELGHEKNKVERLEFLIGTKPKETHGS